VRPSWALDSRSATRSQIAACCHEAPFSGALFCTARADLKASGFATISRLREAAGSSSLRYPTPRKYKPIQRKTGRLTKSSHRVQKWGKIYIASAVDLGGRGAGCLPGKTTQAQELESAESKLTSIRAQNGTYDGSQKPEECSQMGAQVPSG